MIYEYKHTGETTEEFAERIKEKHNAKHVAMWEIRSLGVGDLH